MEFADRVDRDKSGSKIHVLSDDLSAWVRGRGIKVRIVRKGTESSKKLGKHCQVIERFVGWLFGYHRPMTRYDRYATTSAPSSLAAASPASRRSPTETPS